MMDISGIFSVFASTAPAYCWFCISHLSHVTSSSSDDLLQYPDQAPSARYPVEYASLGLGVHPVLSSLSNKLAQLKAQKPGF